MITLVGGLNIGKPENWAFGDLNGAGERDNHPLSFPLLTCLEDRFTWRATRLL